MLIVWTIFTAFSLLSYFAEAAEDSSCSFFTEEGPCNAIASCSWVSSGSTCQCASEVKLDILFAIDTSGSIGWEGFQIQKQFLSDLVTQNINDGSKLGFVMFSTSVNFSREIQIWDTAELGDYVDGIRWVGGYTNTPEVISQSLTEFAGEDTTYVPDSERQQILMMITDGNPCLPEALGGCPQSVCQYKSAVKTEGIRVIIIGVGKDLRQEYVSCLLQTEDDFINIDSFDQLSTIMGSISDVLCPMVKEFVITEVKALKKDDSWSNATDHRYSRFVEFYNVGVGFNLNDISATGLFDMAQGPDVDVVQGQYVVFYDAKDVPKPSIVSCHMCGTDCTMASVCDAFTVTGEDSYCWCQNSIYIACGNLDGACDGSSLSVPNDGYPSGQAEAIDWCSGCTFNNPGKTNWNIQFDDFTTTELIDSVQHDTNTWITTTDRYSYELRSRGYDNDDGGNWIQSCNPLGTPGADPMAVCNDECMTGDCEGLYSTCDTTTGMCDCDPVTGYYPSCTTSTSCTKCLQVPQVGDCSVWWTKNGTERKATYIWDDVGPDTGSRYILTTYSGSTQGKTLVIGDVGAGDWDPVDCEQCLYEPILATSNYWPKNVSYGGYVQVAIDQCTGDVCDVYKGQITMCNVITADPTLSPTPAPTDPPTKSPSQDPTMSPTFACPEVYWVGGTEQSICVPDDRCNCATASKTCCLMDSIFEPGVYDTNRKHHLKFECKLDVQKTKGVDYRNDIEADAGTSYGYLLLMNTNHYFAIDVLPEDYDCGLDIFWRFEWISTNCDYNADEDGRRRLGNCDSSMNSLEQVGMEIDVTSGWLHATSGDDDKNLVVKFRVSPLECDDDDQGDQDTQRRRLSSTDCYDGVALYGRMVIVNVTSDCRSDCWDGRIYPMEIPVWYNYDAAFYIPPGEEKELAAWLWWLIAALALFLCCLMFLVYKYWWKSQATGAALTGVQKDLDAAVMEAEDGFGSGLKGNQVGFNPLATGFNPNAPAGNGVPNRPPEQGGGGADFIRPNVERPKFQVQYGQQMGNLR